MSAAEGQRSPGALAAVEGTTRPPSERRTLGRFFAVGILGYAIYVGLLFIIYDLRLLHFLPQKDTHADLVLFTHGDVLLLIATIAASQASIAAVFVVHNLWTFAGRAYLRPLWVRLWQFEAKALISILGVLSLTINAITLITGLHPFFAVPAGMVLAFICNWLIDSRLIWGSPSLRES